MLNATFSATPEAFDPGICARIPPRFNRDREVIIQWAKQLAKATREVARQRGARYSVQSLDLILWGWEADTCVKVAEVWEFAGAFLDDPTVRSLYNGLTAVSQQAAARIASAEPDAIPPLPKPPGGVNWVGATLIGLGIAGGIFAAVKFWPR